jgi:hypothetical protein
MCKAPRWRRNSHRHDQAHAHLCDVVGPAAPGRAPRSKVVQHAHHTAQPALHGIEVEHLAAASAGAGSSSSAVLAVRAGAGQAAVVVAAACSSSCLRGQA